MARTSYAVGVLSKYGQVQHNDRGQYWLERDGHVISVIDQASEALCIKVRGSADVDDPLTDYYGGVYVNSIKRAIEIAGW